MSTLINLNKARKVKARAEKRARAAENVAKHGRTKAERQAEAAREDQRVKRIDAHKRET